MVALHELFGHGTGKLLTQIPDGLKNPFTGEDVKTCYQEKERFNERFGEISEAYEDCRADCIALYLMMQSDIPFQIFFPDKSNEDWDSIRYCAWIFVFA